MPSVASAEASVVSALISSLDAFLPSPDTPIENVLSVKAAPSDTRIVNLNMCHQTM